MNEDFESRMARRKQQEREDEDKKKKREAELAAATEKQRVSDLSNSYLRRTGRTEMKP